MVKADADFGEVMAKPCPGCAALAAALREMLTAVEQLGIFPDGIVARNARAALSDAGEPQEELGR